MRIVKKIILILFIVTTTIIGSSIALLYFYQDDIKELFVKEVNDQINVSIDVGNIELTVFQDFPNISLLLQNVVVHNHHNFSSTSFPSNVNNNILHASTLKIHADVIELLKNRIIKIKNIEIVNGNLNVLIDKKGNTNLDLITKNDSSSNKLNIEKILAKNISLNYFQLKSKVHINLQKANFIFKIKFIKKETEIIGDFKIKDLKFTQENYIINIRNIDGNTQLLHKKDKLKINDLDFVSNLGNIKIYDGYVSNNVSEIKLKYNDIQATKVLPFFPKNNFDKYDITGEFNGELSLFLNSKKTSLSAIVLTNNASFIYENKDYSINKFESSLKCGNVNDLTTYSVEVKSSQFESNEINASINLSINNFKQKNIKANSKGTYKLNNYKNEVIYIDSCLLNYNLENIDVTFTDSIKLKSLINKSLSLKGKVQNLYGKYKNDYKIENLNCLFEIKNNELLISDLKFIENNCHYALSTKLHNLLDLTNNNLLKFKAKVEVDNFDLNYHLDHLDKISKSSNIIFDIIIDFHSNNFRFNNFNANNVSGLITYTNKTVNLIATEFNSCGGKIELNANLRALENSYFVGSEVIINDINIDSLFSSFQNFNQDFILDSHLKGKTTGTLLITSEFSKNFEFNWQRLNAELDLSIVKGELINFEPLENLSRFAKVEELQHVKFNKLENTIFIKDQIVTIPQMDINSSAFNISISGTHNFESEFSYHLKVLLSDILSKRRKKKAQNSEFGEIEEDGQGRTMLFINIEGTPDEYNVKYDRKKAREKVSSDFKDEKNELRNIFKEEFKIFRKDSTLRKINNTEEKESFVIEWEEDENLN
jgi:AsmA-like C-terminal region